MTPIQQITESVLTQTDAVCAIIGRFRALGDSASRQRAEQSLGEYRQAMKQRELELEEELVAIRTIRQSVDDDWTNAIKSSK